MTGSSNWWPFLAAVVVAAGVGYGAGGHTDDLQRLSEQLFGLGSQARAGDEASAASDGSAQAAAPAAASAEWSIAAPGRVEPASGEVDLGTPLLGRVAEISVEEGSSVEAGDLIIRLDDDEVEAKAAALEADVQVRMRDRNDVDATSRAARDMRAAEDAVASAERLFWKHRSELDRLTAAFRVGKATAAAIGKARADKAAAETALAAAESVLENLKAAADAPVPTRAESALAAARAERSALAALMEKSRIRAPLTGVILRLEAKVGEIVAPSPELALAVVGDTAHLRVRTEVDERDAGKVRVGQTAEVISDSFAGKSFTGKVARISPALSTPRLGSRGMLKRTDVDILEVFVDLEPAPELLPGMRVDVLIRSPNPS